MVLPPESPEELYAFFVPNLIKPPAKHGYVSSGIQLDRSGWHIEIYRRHIDDSLFMWSYHSNGQSKWVMSYDKFTDPSKES